MPDDQIKIANVSVKKSETDYELLSIKQYLKIPMADRFKMIERKEVEFIDFDGEKVPIREGIRALSAMVKQMKKDKTFMDFLK